MRSTTRAGGRCPEATSGRQKDQGGTVEGCCCSHDAFLSALTAPDANGTLPIALLAQEFALMRAAEWRCSAAGEAGERRRRIR